MAASGARRRRSSGSPGQGLRRPMHKAVHAARGTQQCAARAHMRQPRVQCGGEGLGGPGDSDRGAGRDVAGEVARPPRATRAVRPCLQRRTRGGAALPQGAVGGTPAPRSRRSGGTPARPVAPSAAPASRPPPTAERALHPPSGEALPPGGAEFHPCAEARRAPGSPRNERSVHAPPGVRPGRRSSNGGCPGPASERASVHAPVGPALTAWTERSVHASAARQGTPGPRARRR